MFSHLTKRFVEVEFWERLDARCPDGEVVQNKGDCGKTKDNGFGTSWTTQLLAFEWEPDHQVSLDSEADDVPDRQETGNVSGVDEKLTPARPVVDLSLNDSHSTIIIIIIIIIIISSSSSSSSSSTTLSTTKTWQLTFDNNYIKS